jgi:hypothetical protein
MRLQHDLSGIDQAETFLDVFEPQIDAVKAGTMMSERLLYLADAKLQILHIMLDALHASADDAQVIEDQVMRFVGHS